jgi:hypothetical protein
MPFHNSRFQRYKYDQGKKGLVEFCRGDVMECAENDLKTIEKRLNELLEFSREELYKDPARFLRMEGLEISPESEIYLAELLRSYNCSQSRIPGSTLRNRFDDRILGNDLKFGLIKKSIGIELAICGKRPSMLESLDSHK